MSNIMHAIGEKVASCTLGQFLFRSADHTLWIMETSAQWFAKPEELTCPPVRPLPWLLFLPMLIWLRTIKAGVDVLDYFRVKESIKPIEVVRFFQVQRRRLRAIKFAGLKNAREISGEERVKEPTEDPNLEENVNLEGNETESSEADIPFEDLQKICEDYHSEDDPDYDPTTHNGEESEDLSNLSASSTCSGSSTLSLRTAELGSESTQTFYSCNNISSESRSLQSPVTGSAACQDISDLTDESEDEALQVIIKSIQADSMKLYEDTNIAFNNEINLKTGNMNVKEESKRNGDDTTVKASESLKTVAEDDRSACQNLITSEQLVIKDKSEQLNETDKKIDI